MPVNKAPEGSDKYNSGSTVNDSQDDDAEFQGMEFVSVRDLVAALTNLLTLEGYQLSPNVNGHFCGFSVFCKSQLDIVGIEHPDDFFYYREVLPSDIASTTKFLRLVKSICESQAETSQSKAVMGMWRDIYYDFSDRATNMRTGVAGVALGSLNSVKRLATLTGRAGYHRVVPQREWFPLALRSFDARELLTLLPDAEAKALMLILGRVLVGAKETEVAEGFIDHTARSYGIIVGTVAGMGKSTLMGYINNCLEKLGYKVATINGNMGKFGWGSVAMADLAYIDDLTDDTQKSLLTSANIKSIVSNDRLKVEEKGMPAVEVKSTAAVLGCTNATNYAHYIGMDAGSISRLNQLDTFNIFELNRKYGVSSKSDAYLIKPYWEAKAKEFNCSTETLAAWLLHSCTQMFLEATGYSVSGNGLLKKDSRKDTLYAQMEACRAEYRIDTNLRHAEELPYVIANLTALALTTVKASQRELMLSNLEFVGFSPDLLISMMEMFANSPARVTKFTDCYPKHLSMDCKKPLREKMNDLRRLSATQSVERSFTTLVGELKSTKSFGYPSRSSAYESIWGNAKRDIPGMIEDYEVMLQENDIEDGSPLAVALTTIKTHVANIVK